MSDVRLDPFVRALMADTAVATEQFAVGQRWTGRVVQALPDERFVVTLGDLRLLAQSALPLTPGQRIVVEVMSAGDPVELRLRSASSTDRAGETIRLVSADTAPQEAAAGQAPAAPEAAERNYQLAALLNALSSAPEGKSANKDAAARAAAALRQSVFALLRSDEADGLQQILQPLLLNAASSQTARALQEWLQNGGFLFEAHVRALLAESQAATGEQILDALRGDLKTLLGRLALRCARRVQAPSDSEGDAELAATLVEDDVLRAGAACRDAVAERLLGDQAELAYRWLSEGVLAFEVPVALPGREARALVRFHRDSTASHEDAAGGAAWSVTVHVESEDFGAVQATARWREGQCDAMFFVDRPQAHDALAAQLGSLEAGLGTLFARVTAGVSLDEARARRPVSAIRAPEAPGGSIVNVRI